MNPYRFFYLLGIHKLFYTVKKFNGHSVTVLCFHRVSDEEDFFWQPLRISDFEKIIQYCVAHYRIISLSDLHSNKLSHSGKPFLAITFDDGYKDFISNALPVLKKYNLPSNHNVVVNSVDGKENIWTQNLNSIFNFCKTNNLKKQIDLDNFIFEFDGINTDWKKIYLSALFYFFKLEKESREENLKALLKQAGTTIKKADYMNWDDLKICMAAKVEIGSHSMSHDVLDTINDREKLLYEINSSKQRIETMTGMETTTLAFPNGKNNSEAIKVAIESGYKNILFTEDKIFHFSPDHSQNTLLIPRMSIYDGGYQSEILRIENFQNTVKKMFRQ